MKEALKLALEALERSVATCFDQYAHQQVRSQPDHFINQAITALRLAIDVQNMASESTYKAALAQRTWSDLTEDEMDKVRQSMGYNECMSAGEYAKLVQIATQTKLKEKNNG